MTKILLITIEGLDASGKTTLARRLYHFWKQKNWYLVQYINSVDGILTGDAIKNKYYALSRTDKQQFWALQFKKLLVNIKKNISQNQPNIIIFDRWFDSFMVYQGRWDQWKSMTTIRTQLDQILPVQIKFFLKTSLPVVQKRWAAKKNLSFPADLFHKLAELYQQILQPDKRVKIISGDPQPEQVLVNVVQHMNIWMQQHGW